MESQKEQVQNLLTKIESQELTKDKLEIVTRYSKQAESILETIKPKASRATKILIETFNDLLQANYETLLEGGMGNCRDCLIEARIILDRITFPLS